MPFVRGFKNRGIIKCGYSRNLFNGRRKMMDKHEDTMDYRRWNQFISYVNYGMSKESLNPPIQNEEEDRIFDNMAKELEEMRKTNPKAAFWPVENDW